MPSLTTEPTELRLEHVSIVDTIVALIQVIECIEHHFSILDMGIHIGSLALARSVVIDQHRVGLIAKLFFKTYDIRSLLIDTASLNLVCRHVDSLVLIMNGLDDCFDLGQHISRRICLFQSKMGANKKGPLHIVFIRARELLKKI